MISDIEVMNSGLEVLIRSIGNIDAKRFLLWLVKRKLIKKMERKFVHK